MQFFQFIAMSFSMVDMDINDKFDFLDITPMLAENYFSRKKELVSLKNRYLELTNHALNPSTVWYKSAYWLP